MVRRRTEPGWTAVAGAVTRRGAAPKDNSDDSDRSDPSAAIKIGRMTPSRFIVPPHEQTGFSVGLDGGRRSVVIGGSRPPGGSRKWRPGRAPRGAARNQ